MSEQTIRKILVLIIVVCLSTSIYLVVKGINTPKEKVSVIDQYVITEVINDLAKTKNSSRNIEARLTFYSIYQPYEFNKTLVDKLKKDSNVVAENILDENELNSKPNRGQNSKAKETDSKELEHVKLKILVDDYDKPSDETARGVASIHIMEGEFDKAVDRLEEAVKHSPNNPLLLNDLAVAYLTRAEYENQPQDLAYALSNIDKAVAAEPKNPATTILFNRALMLEKFFLDRLAKAAWQHYLTVETNPEWLIEAHRHLDQLNAPTFDQIWEAEKTKLNRAVLSNDLNTANTIIKKYPHPSRMYAIDELLPAWADAYLIEKKDVAEEQLRVAEFIGDKLATLQQDNLVQDMVKIVISLNSNPLADKQRHDLATAHQFYGKAKYFLERSEIGNSLINLKSAATIFNKVNDIASLNHMYLHIARCEMTSLHYENALSIAKNLISISQQHNYPYLLGRTYAVNGYIFQNQVELSKAIQAIQKSIKYLETINDNQDLAIAYSNLGTVFSTLNIQDKALASSYQSLKQYRQVIKNSRYYISLGDLGKGLLCLNFSKIAIYFYDEAIHSGVENKIETLVVSTLVKRIQAYQPLNKTFLVLEDIKLARSYNNNIADKDFQIRAEQEIDLVEATFYLNDMPQKAIELYTKLIKDIVQTSDNFYKKQLYLSRAKAYLIVGDVVSAEYDLNVAIEEIEKQRKAITEEGYRTSFFTEPISAYEEMAKLKIDYNNQIELAFDYIERSHARTLLDTIEYYQQNNKSTKKLSLKNVANPLKLNQIQNHLPEKTALVQYLVLSDQIFIWLIKKDSFDFVKSPLKQTELNKIISQYWHDLEKNTPKEKLTIYSDELYKELITPIASFISDTENLVIIPDKELYKIPYVALTSPTTGKYLLEEKVISYSPSATIFINSIKRDGMLANEVEQKTLAIGNPTFSKEKFPNFSDLSGAEKEAEKVAKIYPNSLLLPKDQATKQAFGRLASQYNTIHFAGHSIVNTKSPLYSLMLMAAEKNSEEDNSALYAYELYWYNFDKAQLVVLAACQTANGQLIEGEGVISMARPFLAKGVPAVIASLWNANDQASATLFTEFHKRRVAGESTALALRNAQLSLTENSIYETPRNWAPFILFGYNQSK